MKNKFEKNVWWVNFDNKIEEINYGELVEMFADETTTPNGIAPRYHIRENKEYGTFDLWTWGVQGNNPKFVKDFNTEKEANYALYETFELDMLGNEQYSVTYADTKKELEELLEDFVNLN
jgi:hypothetical protein